MGGKRDDRLVEVGVVAALAAVPAVFGAHHARLFDRVPIRVGPAQVHALFQDVHLLGDAFGVIELVVVSGVDGVEPVAAHHDHEELLRDRVPRDTDRMAVAGGEMNSIRLRLPGLVRVEHPVAAVGFQKLVDLGGGLALRAELAVAGGVGVGR